MDPKKSPSEEQTWRDIRVTTRDGLVIYGRHYPAPQSKRRPVVCLAGLTRNSRDFHVIAEALSGTGADARDIYTVDTRGRGLSDYSVDWKNYIVPIEMLDVQDFMYAEGLHAAGIIGTSRGGILTMVLGAVQPSLIGPVVLNDIGPVIDMLGLVRIGGYVGKVPLPKTWPEAANQVAKGGKVLFPNVSDAEWAEVARQWFNDDHGVPAYSYDQNLSKSFSVKDGEAPKLWPQFLSLSRNPCLVLRGANSDLLSEATVAEMVRRHPDCASYTVPAQGHAPLLRDQPTINEIRKFFETHDAH